MTDRSSQRLPPYVDRLGHGEICMPPPGQVDEATVAMFAVPVTHRERLQSFVDTALNHAGGPRYVVAADLVLVCFLSAPRLGSGHAAIGTVPDHEVAIWVPLVQWHGLLPRLSVWMPYIWVDTDIAMVTGREIWGFPKELGRYIPPADGDPYVLRASVFRKFGADATAEDVELLTVTTTARGSHGHAVQGPDEFARTGDSPWRTLGDAGRDISRLLGGGSRRRLRGAPDGAELPAAVVDFVELALRARVPVVNLKQIRDAVDPGAACYQALVASELELTSFHGGGPLWGQHQLRIEPCESHDLVADLGLAGHELDALFGLWVTMDFLVPAGEVLWQAT